MSLYDGTFHKLIDGKTMLFSDGVSQNLDSSLAFPLQITVQQNNDVDFQYDKQKFDWFQNGKISGNCYATTWKDGQSRAVKCMFDCTDY